ncbi:transmembrane and coiled-coil domain-containing protein 4 isoform X2 [Latimeria chalumnae]|uniref:transmembrane and coiled-coil domain-containing protein 4 isoform X2 n=1 Tax=Latimeria chalumnae TaxID=7897 RepID=UPI00313B4AAD
MEAPGRWGERDFPADTNDDTTEVDRTSAVSPVVKEDREEEEKPLELVGKLLHEVGRFAYAGLCGVSLAVLFPEEEHRSFRLGFVKGLMQWLELSDTVLPVMETFANGIGEEGTEMFAKILLEEPVLKDNPIAVIQDLVSFSAKDGYYDARARVLICHIAWLLRVPFEELEVFEESLIESLKEQKQEQSEEMEKARKKKETKKKVKRYLLIGLATVGGGTLIGYKMKKRVGAIEEFEFLPLTEGKQMHITIAITGWLSTGKYGSFIVPWSNLAHSSEQYCLAWESKYLMALGNGLEYMLNGILSQVTQEALKLTVLSGILTALAWPSSILTVSSVIDNPWGVCLSRSAEVGKHLADLLLRRQQGNRPVSLIGFSLGARVIYFCLQELAREKGCEGIIQDVVLLGAPVEGAVKYWKPLTKVVAGKIINGYCRGDWLLKFVYRTSSVKIDIAGLQPIDLDDRRMTNVDLTPIVNGHLDYMKKIDTILDAVGVRTKESCAKGIWCINPFLNQSEEASEEGEKQQENTAAKTEMTEETNDHSSQVPDDVSNWGLVQATHTDSDGKVSMSSAQRNSSPVDENLVSTNKPTPAMSSDGSQSGSGVPARPISGLF